MDKRFIQLYSLKDVIADDFVGTLRRLREMGYTGVEFASGFYGGYGAPELKAVLADAGLAAIGSHIGVDNVPGHLDFAARLGLKYLIDPWYHMNTHEEALEAARRFNEAGKLCAAAGIRFGYHNHRHEFLPGEDGYLLETLLINTDPELVCFELDVGWAACSGADSAALINKYPGRFKLIHVKECGHVAGPEKVPDFSIYPKNEQGQPQLPPDVLEKILAEIKWNVPSGRGIIDWAAVRDAACAQGAEAFIVEREYDYADDIFKCVQEDCDFLASL